MTRRIDPRRPFVVAASGLRRIVLGSSEGERGAARNATSAPAAKPLRSKGPFKRCVLVVAHADRGALDDHARQVVAAAAILARPDTEVLLAVLGACHDDAAALGADRLLVAADADPSRWQAEAETRWLSDLADLVAPDHVLLPDRDADADLGRRFAVRTRRAIATQVVELKADAARVRAGPAADAVCAPTPVLLLAKGVADTRLPFVGLGLAQPAPALADAPGPVHDLGLKRGDAQSLALEEADLILAAGNGVRDLELFHQLAQQLGAATGASRVAVDDGRFARDKQIGATGKTVQASGYLALGISGAVQHLQGIRECRHVIAVNTDAAAPITRRAVLTAVEDSGALMRALLDLVQHHKGATP